jgi:hypothetical protein
VRWDVDVDLTMPSTELTIQAAVVRGAPCVAKTVQHVPENSEKAGTVQPITTEPPVGTKGGIGVVIHLSKQRRNGSTFHLTDSDNSKLA